MMHCFFSKNKHLKNFINDNSILDIILLIFFLLKQKETKILGETPTSILFSLKKSSQFLRKNCSSHRFAKNHRAITNVCSNYKKGEESFFIKYRKCLFRNKLKGLFDE